MLARARTQASASPIPCAVRPVVARPDEGAGRTVHGLPKRQKHAAAAAAPQPLQHTLLQQPGARWCQHRLQ
eukprot:9489206-Lingulodinium_polyedra.AAC.1